MGIQLDVQNTVRTASLPSASCVLNIQFAYRGRPQCRSSALAPHVDVIWYLLHRMNGLHRKVLNQIVREAGSDKSNARVHNKAREVCGQSKLTYLGRRVLSSY